MLHSQVLARGKVSFPDHNGDRIYMVPFTKKQGVPAFMAQWQRTVDEMLDGVEAPGPIYIMVDQKLVKASLTHRRPGMHIDGWWIPVEGEHPGLSLKKPSDAGKHGGGRHGTHVTFGMKAWPDEAIFLASDVSACRAVVGDFAGEAGEGGDCRHLDLSAGKEVIFDANRAYSGNVTMLHESMPVAVDTLRTVVRLNVPGIFI